MGNEIKISDLTEKLQALAKKADQDSVEGNKNNKLDSEIELSIFRGYVNDAEAKKTLDADDKANLKSIMGYTPVARSIDDVVAKAQGKTNTAVVQDSASAVTTGTRTPMVAFKEYSKTMGPKAAYKKVKEEFKDQKEFKKDVKEVKKYAKEVTRQQNAMRAIDQAEAEFRAKGEYDVSQRKIRARAKEILAEQNGGKIDKWDRGAVNGSNNLISRVTFQKSAMKKYAEGASDALSATGAVTTKDGKLRTYTFSELQDKLGKKHPYLQMVDDGNGKQVTLLEKAGLVTQSNGSFDITNLANLVKSQLGADNEASRQKDPEKNERRLLHEKIINLIEKSSGQDFSANKDKDKIVNKIIDDLCGYGIEHKNYREAIAQGIFGGALAGGAAGLALLMQGKDIVRGTVTNNNKLDVFIKLDQYTSMGNISFGDTNLDSLVASGQATTETVGDVVHINIDQKYAQPFYHEASKHILKNMGKAGAIGGAIALLEALTHYGKSEDQVIRRLPGKCDEIKGFDNGKPVYYNMENFHEFQDYLNGAKQMHPLYKEALEMLAASYTDFSKNPPVLAYQNMKDDLNNYAGRGSNLNATELLRSLKEAQAKSKEELQGERCDDEVKQPEKDKEYWGSQKRTDGEIIKTPAPKTDKFEDWGVFASRYDCLKDFDSKFKYVYDSKLRKNVPNTYARTMMKVMQAITDDNYELARLQELTEKAMSGNWRSLKDVEGFNFNVYEALRGNRRNNSFAVDRQNMPTITTVDGNNEKVDICAPEEPKYQIGRQSGGKAKKTNIGGANNSRMGEGSYTGGLETSDGKKIPTTNEQDYTNKEQKLQEQGYKKRTKKGS